MRVVGGVLAEAGTAVQQHSGQQCQLQLWTGTPLITTMALKLITLALTALVLVQVGHYTYSHSNLQYKRPLCEEN